MWFILQMVVLISFMLVLALILLVIVRFSFFAIGFIIIVGAIAGIIWFIICKTSRPFW